MPHSRERCAVASMFVAVGAASRRTASMTHPPRLTYLRTYVPYVFTPHPSPGISAGIYGEVKGLTDVRAYALFFFTDGVGCGSSRTTDSSLSGMLSLRCGARRDGARCCLSMPCQLITVRVRTPPRTCSVISTFQAPS